MNGHTFFGDPLPPSMHLNTVKLFGLPIVNAHYAQALEHLKTLIADESSPCQLLLTPNVDHIVKIHQHSEWMQLYQQADYFFPDGTPIILASRLFGTPLKQRITGADLFTDLCLHANQEKKRVFVLGGLPEEHRSLKKAFSARCPELSLQLFTPPKGFDEQHPDMHKVIKDIQVFQPHILFICLGFPKQERIAIQLKKHINHGIVLGVGAALYFFTGKKKRAPLWIQNIGMEWFWRLLSEPKRLWRRYLVEDVFFLSLCWHHWRNTQHKKT